MSVWLRVGVVDPQHSSVFQNSEEVTIVCKSYLTKEIVTHVFLEK